MGQTADTVFIEIAVTGPDFTDVDLEEARRHLGSFAPTRATGAWAPAAEPTFIEFFIKAVAGGVGTGIGIQIGKKLWEQAWPLLSAFLEERIERTGRESDIRRIVIAVDELEIVLHWPSEQFLEHNQGEFLYRVHERLTNGRLASLAIQQIVLPVTIDDDGPRVPRWREYEGEYPTRYWQVRTRNPEPGIGFYDSESDTWI